MRSAKANLGKFEQESHQIAILQRLSVTKKARLFRKIQATNFSFYKSAVCVFLQIVFSSADYPQVYLYSVFLPISSLLMFVFPQFLFLATSLRFI